MAENESQGPAVVQLAELTTDKKDLNNLDDLTLDELELFKKRMIEDGRMDSIFRLKQNLNEKFDNRAYLHPHGMTEFDYKSIPENRREQFEKFKHKTRHENYQYLGGHYELDAMLALFFKKLLSVKPQDSIHFAAEFFTSDILMSNFQGLLDNEKRKISNYRVAKMKIAQKITTTVVHEMRKPENKEVKQYERCFRKSKDKHCDDKKPVAIIVNPQEVGIKPQDENLNWLKKLNIGPLAQDFDTRVILPPPVVEIKEAVYKKRVKKFYCGCKDPGRRLVSHAKKTIVETPPSPEDEDDEDGSDDDEDDEDDIAEPANAPPVSVVNAKKQVEFV